ncbi:MAG: hypothetical protein K9G29_10025 [Crocinitomicaceae bacterium]|nr:hypothetical protein [Crocinitomicaceae bacterium]
MKKVDSVEDVAKVQVGADAAVPVVDVPKDAVNVDTEEGETKFMMSGSKTIENAWLEYTKNYIPEILNHLIAHGGINSGRFYTLGITSFRQGKLGNAVVHDTPKDEKKLTGKEKKQKKEDAFVLISQCKVLELGVMEGFYKKFILGVRIKLTDAAVKKGIGEWLYKINSRIESEQKKFKHIQTETNDFDTVLGENEFAIPVHWIPRIREIIENNISNKTKEDAKRAEDDTLFRKQHTTPIEKHIKAGYEDKVEKPSVIKLIKLPPRGSR